MTKQTFKKEEKLKSRKRIRQLFEKGQSVAAFPLRLVWLELEEGSESKFPAQFSLSVSKKKFSNATDRNRIRRLVREAYRLNKNYLYEKLNEQNRHFAFMVIFTGNEIPEFSEVEKAMIKLLGKFLRHI